MDPFNLPTAWKKILKSAPFWALIITQTGFTWGYWTLLTEIPIYMSYVMKFSFESNGVLASLPYLMQWILSFFFSTLSDSLINKKVCSVGTTRKLMNMIGLTIPGVALFILGNCGPNDYKTAVVALIVAGGVSSACLSGHTVNHMDLSPNHSGTLMGLSNQVAVSISALGPTLVQYLVTNEVDPIQWRIIFYITAILYFMATIIFTMFGSGEVQSWNYTRKECLPEDP